MANIWFTYDCFGGNDDPGSYNIVAGVPNCPAPKFSLCAIFAEIQLINGVQRPILTTDLLNEISKALTLLTDTANVKLQPSC